MIVIKVVNFRNRSTQIESFLDFWACRIVNHLIISFPIIDINSLYVLKLNPLLLNTLECLCLFAHSAALTYHAADPMSVILAPFLIYDVQILAFVALLVEHI